MRQSGFGREEMDDWSWPKFWQRARLVEELEMQKAILTSRAVWDPRSVQAELMGQAQAENEWQPMSMERLKAMMDGNAN